MALAFVLGSHLPAHLHHVAVEREATVVGAGADVDPRAQLDVAVQHRVGLTGQKPRMADRAAPVQVVSVADFGEVHRGQLAAVDELERAQHGAGGEQLSGGRWSRSGADRCCDGDHGRRVRRVRRCRWLERCRQDR